MLRSPMSSSPAQSYACPRCHTAFDEASQFCRQCGAEMLAAGVVPPPGAVDETVL